MNPYLLAARPKTLSASVVPVLVGTALAWPKIHWISFACALTGAVFIQIGTNLVNDALDFKRGADTAERLGPLRVTQAGLLSADAVLRGAYVCFFLAALCGIPLIIRGGWPLLAIGLTSIAAAYAYTGGPFPIAYHGLSELFVLIFFGFIAVGGSYYVQRLQIDERAIIAGFAVGCLAVVLLAINNLRDVESDRASNKKTLVVRFGETFGRVEIATCALLPFGAAVLIKQWMVLLALPLAIYVCICVLRARPLIPSLSEDPSPREAGRGWREAPGAGLNRCLALAGALQWAFGILFVVGSLL